jgi:integrase
MGLGSTAIRSLADARALATSYHKHVVNGLDPIEERRLEALNRQIEHAKSVTFDEVAKQCIAAKTPEWKNAKHAQQWKNTLETYVSPVFGALPISAVDTMQVMRVLEPIWVTKTETATRVRQRIEKIIDYAKARGYFQGENPARLEGNLRELLPSASKTKNVKHFGALPYKEIRTFVGQLRQQAGVTSLALEFLILTAARTSEVIGATWGEFDFEAKVWTVPSSRMKAGKEHRVPLCARALEIIASINSTHTTTEFVFPGWRGSTSLSNGAMLALVKKMEWPGVTPHGFRSTFRDWASEEAHSFQNETVELALAHQIKNQAERAYRRGDQLERRRDLMAAWQSYIDTDRSAPENNVIALRRA